MIIPLLMIFITPGERIPEAAVVHISDRGASIGPGTPRVLGESTWDHRGSRELYTTGPEKARKC